MHIKLVIELVDTGKQDVTAAQAKLFNDLQQQVNALVRKHATVVDDDWGVYSSICDDNGEAIY